MKSTNYIRPGGPGGVFPIRKKRNKKRNNKIKCCCGGDLNFYDVGFFCFKKHVVKCNKCKYKKSVTL